MDYRDMSRYTMCPIDNPTEPTDQKWLVTFFDEFDNIIGFEEREGDTFFIEVEIYLDWLYVQPESVILSEIGAIDPQYSSYLERII